jgi:glycosyltransferase involved in cell wall biosynthesis
VITALLDLSVLATEPTAPGISRYVADLALELDRIAAERQGLQVLAVEALPWLRRSRVSADVRSSVERLLQRPDRQKPATWAYQVRLALPRAVRNAQPDLVHSGAPHATPVGKLSCPRVLTCHDLVPLAYPAQRGWRNGGLLGRYRTHHRRFHSADHVIAISRTTADDLINRLGIPHQQISVVHNGVDLTRWTAEPRPEDAAVRIAHGLQGRPYLLCVGSAHWRKNSEGVMQGLARARRLIGNEDLLVAWAGRLDREERQRVHAAARSAGVEEAVQLLGYVPDVELAALYRGATAQVFVSRAEGFGYPVVEAMACGCPVITSNRSSLIEIAEDAAVTVDPEDADAIADAIVMLADDNAERHRLARSGVRRAQLYSLRRMAEQTLEVYCQVLGSRVGSRP